MYCIHIMYVVYIFTVCVKYAHTVPVVHLSLLVVGHGSSLLTSFGSLSSNISSLKLAKKKPQKSASLPIRAFWVNLIFALEAGLLAQHHQ